VGRPLGSLTGRRCLSMPRPANPGQAGDLGGPAVQEGSIDEEVRRPALTYVRRACRPAACTPCTRPTRVDTSSQMLSWVEVRALSLPASASYLHR
jgi:hypothetical protein